MMKHTITLIMLLSSISIAAQVRDLTLTIEFDNFNDGAFTGEQGIMRVKVANFGPDDYILGTHPLSISGLFNVTNNSFYPFGLFDLPTSDDPDCVYVYPHIDPRPPVNDYQIYSWISINKNMAANETILCEFDIRITQSGYFDLLWIVDRYSQHDPNLNNNEAQFTFRGQVMPVPLSMTLNLILIVGILLLCGILFRNKKCP